MRIGINGMGRIGRAVVRAWLSDDRGLELVHLNDLAPAETTAHLLRYDTVHGGLALPCAVASGQLHVGQRRFSLTASQAPAEIDWAEHGVELVLECSGVFTARGAAAAHLAGGVRGVLISAPATDEDLTVVYGVNHAQLGAGQQIVSAASCTTNCLAPLAKVFDEAFGIESGLMTTVHSYTNDQRVLDVAHGDLRRARAAALNMIPTSTGAAKAIGLVLPHLSGKIDGLAVRVPTPNVSLVDVCFQLRRPATVEEASARLVQAAAGELAGVLGITTGPLVSSDFLGSPLSSIVDTPMIRVSGGGHLVKVLAWYDNEVGFSHRMLDVAAHWARHLA